MGTSKAHTENADARQAARGRPAAAPRETSGSGAARRETPASGAAVPPPLTADVLRAAQRGAGNAAVTAMIARRAAAAPAPQQPDTGVHEVLRSTGRPLAEPVRQEMESRLGADFSDVRLHTGAAAARSARAIGARAYTSGSHVVIGEGGGDKHTLAHELTHVVQQRTGPVAGTDNGAGLSISDPSDRFEREAEANARRVLTGPVPAARTADAATTAAGPGPAAAPDAHQVQRAVGFEFEVADEGWEFKEDGHKKSDTKKELIKLKQDLSYVAADNGNVEFVTRPLDTLDQVRAALKDIVEFHDRLAAGKRPYREGAYTITARGEGQARPQATFGIRMQDIGALVETLRRRMEQEDAPPPAKSTRLLRSAGAGSKEQREISNRVTSGLSNLQKNNERAKRIVDAVAARTADAPADDSVKEVTGFLTVVMKTLDDAGGTNEGLVDPKYFFSMMPRTDFVTMFKSMSDAATTWLSGHRGDVYTAMTDEGFPVDERVFGGRYKMEVPNDGRDWRLSRRTWLDPVLSGDASVAKDELSPPPGYPRHTGESTDQGLGAMSTDGEGLSLFEMRALGRNSFDKMPKEQWTPLAEFIARLVGEATGDERLNPQET
jgi:hypothetical protein